MHVCHCFNRVQFCVTLWTVALQAPLSMGFFRQEDWIGLPCPSPGGLPNSGIEPAFLTSPALECGFFTTSATWEAPKDSLLCHNFIYLFLFFTSFFFWLHCVACEVLVPRPGIKPAPPALEAQSLNHWTAREVQPCHDFEYIYLKMLYLIRNLKISGLT